MPYTVEGKNKMLDALGASYASLHTADPGETGTNEVSGGSYARQAITFGAASAGAIDSANQPVFSVPAGTTITHVSFWDAASGGTCLATSTITNESFTAEGQYTLSDADLDLNA